MNAADAAADRARLWALLGVPRPADAVPSARLLDTSSDGGLAVERWHLDLDGDDPAPALLVRPAAAPLRGVVLYQHAHGHRFDIGKSELVAGRPSLASGPYAQPLAEHGFAALAIDHLGFGERAQESERALFKRLLWHGSSLFGQRVRDAVRAAVWLRRQDAYRGLPLVALGISMGSTLAWWSAALDAGIDAVADLCGLAEYDALLATGGFDGHAEYFFVPGLVREFTAARINALIAPRPHLSLAGRDDPLTPPAGLAGVDAALRSVYAQAGAPGAWRQSVHDCGHEETPAMRREVLRFLDGLADRTATA